MPNPDESNDERKTDHALPGVRFHTDSFSNEEFLNAYDATEKDSNKLPIIAILEYLDHHDYSKIENFLLIHLDSLDGIKSSIVADHDKFPTGIGFVRDATNALPLINRLPANHLHLLKDNVLLRLLGTLRGIDHVLNHKLNATDTVEADKQIYIDAIHNLKVNYNKLLVDVTVTDNLDLKQLEENFYIDLIDILHKTKLDAGITKVKDYSLLLGHYRDMAALIDPAKSLVSISVDNDSLINGSIIHTETCHPITEKSPVQKEQLKVMGTLQLNVPKAEQNFHSAKKRAFQEVNVAFADNAVSEDRRFAPQSRKFIGPGLKNAYKVHYEIDFQQNGESIKSSMTSLRTGSMTYIGNDDTQEHNDQYTYENLVQMKKAGDGKPLHTTMLLTNTSKGREDLIIATTKSASAKLDNKFSLVSLNPLGLAFTPQLAEGFNSPLKNWIQTTDVFTGKASRIAKVGAVANYFTNDDSINNTTCASGVDRSGTAMEITAQQWALAQYEKNKVPTPSRENIENTRVMARHNAVIATLATPGSDGMKKNSLPKGYFVLPETKEVLYRDTAKSNKNPKMNFNVISKLIKNWRAENTPIKKEPLISYAEQTINKINGAENANQITVAIIEWAAKATQYQENKDRAGWLHVGRFFTKNTNSAEADLIHGRVTLLMKDVAKLDTSSKDFTQEFTRIKNEITGLDQEYSSKKLGTAFSLLASITMKADKKIQSMESESKKPEPLFIRISRP